MGFSKLGGLLLILVGLTKAQEDSLRSALNAVDRRQKDLSELPRYEDESIGDYGYSLEGPDDLAFLSASDYNADREMEKSPSLERRLLDYLEDDSYLNSGRNIREDDIKKRISSSFRERLEEDKDRQMEELAQAYLGNPESDQREYSDSDNYNELIRELWEKYRNYPINYNRPRAYLNGEPNKRSRYPKFGLDGAGLRKRNKYYEPENEIPYLYNYGPNDDSFNRVPEDNIDPSDYDAVKSRHRDRKYDSRQRNFNYPGRRFSVTKRSSNYNPHHNFEKIHEHKRSTSKKEPGVIKTDPKVAKDLSNIFGAPTTSKPTLKSEKPVNNTGKKDSKQKPKSEKSEKLKHSSKEVSTGNAQDEPLLIKKKSVDWSDYFGLDRRKKTDQDLDNEWLLERYHKAMSMTAKRNAEYPLQSFKNHDSPSKKEGANDKFLSEEAKISEMDQKLKGMEDTIIDDALKYTGAHEGAVDSKEIQEVKERVISRLAAAYNLDKMRRALNEYKLGIAKEKERLKQQQQQKSGDDYEFSEEKRVSVPRKQAVDEERENTPEADNNIKCSQGDEDCEEQSYKTPSEILDETSFDECPKVQRACNEVATILGHYARVFETACNMHQMCLLCSNNSWFAPTRQCNVLFLTKAFELCDGKQECHKEAQRSVRYLVDVNRSLRLEPLGECELACPDKR